MTLDWEEVERIRSPVHHPTTTLGEEYPIKEYGFTNCELMVTFRRNINDGTRTFLRHCII
ncbi:hypothetical protein ANCDUO_10462 [Ancylostoma duodenale]|uniref:Uncharacterized protein n=1 Tax=Ancylostoma duodenale TaxID=51022 RepID=A0A0C2GDT5_9BILA|nr:hypothetical protein ANCDUO_10462 [Ancylostoma duodenale]